MIHETFNELSDLQLAAGYRRVYGSTRRDGLPVVGRSDERSDIDIDEDVIVAAPLWHDWAKILVFQWNSDGSEFPELNFGGNGQSDDYGASGDSRTGGHHIIGVAEAMTRGRDHRPGRSPQTGISPPRHANRLRLPAVRQLASVDLNELSPMQTNVFLLRNIAGEFGYDSAVASRYNRLFRNPALTYLSAERLLIIYGERGLDGVRNEIRKLRRHGIL